MDSFRTFIKKIRKTTDLGVPFQGGIRGDTSKETKKKSFLGTPFQGGIRADKKDVKEDIHPKGEKDVYKFLRDMPNINPHIAEDVDGVQEALHKHHTTEHLGFEHIKDYTIDSSPLNTHLFEHHAKYGDPYHPVLPEFHHLVHGMDQALSHKPLHVPLKVMSGLKKNPGLTMGPEQRLYHPAYLSTTIKPEVAQSFAERLVPGKNEPGSIHQHSDQHFLLAHLEAGQHGFYVGHNSSYDHEHEFIMPRRTIFQVKDHDVHPCRHPWNPESPVTHFVHIWHAIVHNPDGRP